MDIQPDKQNLEQTFATTIYNIDFYQRDYKWDEDTVLRLLDDIFYQFDETYAKHSSLEPNKENTIAAYPWYYLSTYVTNIVNGQVFVVDGQQRLTTLTLILIKLYSKATELGSKTAKWVERKIAGYSGTELSFWMNHQRQQDVLEQLMAGTDHADISTRTGITAVNMVNNHRLISKYIDDRLTSLHHFDTFVHYFLLRLVLINLSVDTAQVPMVFEVINDRGVRLKPYEILKGKLLGQIDKIELDGGKYNELWEAAVQRVNDFGVDEIDGFFRYYLKAKCVPTRKDGQRFDGDYHREIFKADMDDYLHLEHNPSGVKVFLNGPFRYYSSLYAKLLKAAKAPSTDYPAIFYNKLNDLDTQYMLIISACKVDDPEEALKIHLVSQGIDRMFSTLQLQGAYDSNQFFERMFKISTAIRDLPASKLNGVFEKHHLLELSERRSMDAKEAFSYPLFKNMSIDRLNARFTKYFLGRVEQLLASAMNLQMKHSLKELVTSKGARTGFHIEHILSRNAESLSAFNNDEERFEQERNRLGGVLLLKGLDNISSSNEPYEQKLKSYANTLYWNETLRQDAYKSKIDFRNFIAESKLPFRALDKFGADELEERQQLLFELCKLIWAA